MPDMLTPQALAMAGPLVLETFFKHLLGHKTDKGKGKEKDDLLYDEAFVLMKTFLEIATKYPVASLQKFSQVRTPAPPWVALHRVSIPQPTLTAAAEYLVAAFGGQEMAYKIAGGTKWWQVRAGNGVEGEWIVMKKDWKEVLQKEKQKQEEQGGTHGFQEKSGNGEVGEDGGVDDNGSFRKEMDELRCMLYIHGGAYYWGSINTHRYTIWRYARKMHGRCFAVNYRKAPQYPFPCAIQDCLASYLYLTHPPPGSKHRPVSPKNIILAGDSAGGGLVLALLQILRDTEGLELPAGAVLISPWSDLTHSFPSILQNTATDIVPPYGFIHKPSSLWPPPPPALTDEMQNRLRSRVKEAVSRLKHDHLHTAEHHRRASIASKKEENAPLVNDHPTQVPATLRSSDANESGNHNVLRNGGGEEGGKHNLHPVTEGGEDEQHPGPRGEPRHNPSRANPGLLFDSLASKGGEQVRPTTLAQCDTPLDLEVKEEKVEIDTQIQLYATNAQLCHPFVSPVLGYLGGLPPLLIVAGQNEVLRDEIIFVAHKAANPGKYPIRDDVRRMLPSLEGIEERCGPTEVHLQVYDGACHDLPLFSMVKAARGLFRAVASFARYVTPSAPGSLSISKTPGGSTTPRTGSETPTPSATPRSAGSHTPELRMSHIDASGGDLQGSGAHSDTPDQEFTGDFPDSAMLSSDQDVTRSPTVMTPRHSTFDSTLSSRLAELDLPRSGSPPLEPALPMIVTTRPLQEKSRSDVPGDDAGPRWEEREDEKGVEEEDPASRDSKAKPGEAGHSGIYRGSNPFGDSHMIRERVATTGKCRPLEEPSDLAALTMPLDEVGTIKEGPAMRYLNGQALWDKRYHRATKHVKKHREKNLKMAKEKDGQKLAEKWRIRLQEAEQSEADESDELSDDEDNDIDQGRSGTVSDGSALGVARRKGKKRKGTKGERLWDQSWSWSWALDGEAPPPSAIVSRRDFGEARQLALMADRMDSAHDTSIHGLSIWVGLASFFSNSSERNRAGEAVRQAREVRKAGKAHRNEVRSEGEGVGRSGKEGKGERFMNVVKRALGRKGRKEGKVADGTETE